MEIVEETVRVQMTSVFLLLTEKCFVKACFEIQAERAR
jgi:hypothetical protein